MVALLRWISDSSNVRNSHAMAETLTSAKTDGQRTSAGQSLSFSLRACTKLEIDDNPAQVMEHQTVSVYALSCDQKENEP